MAEIVQKVLIWIAAVIAAFIIYRLIFSPRKESAASSYERQVEEILTSEKYRVKGRFE